MNGVIRIVLKTLSCLFALLVFNNPSVFSPLQAGIQEPGFVIRSLYRDPVSKAWKNEVIWEFHVKEPTCLTVTRQNRTKPVLTLHYSPDGPLEHVEDHVSGIHGSGLAKGDKIVLSWGFPVPYDYLAPFDRSLDKAVLRRKAGGRVFRFEIKRDIRPITLDQAIHDGMVAPHQRESLSGKDLHLVIIKAEDRVLVKQLWAGGMAWWLYEETSHRKSWLVGE